MFPEDPGSQFWNIYRVVFLIILLIVVNCGILIVVGQLKIIVIVEGERWLTVFVSVFVFVCVFLCLLVFSVYFTLLM